MDIFSDKQAGVRVSPYKIYVCQAGYFPDGKKTAAMAFPCEEFALSDEDGNIRYRGRTKHFGFDKSSGDDVYTADFSDFSDTGKFRVISCGESSALFEIGHNVYGKLFDDVLKAFYYLRCGCGLDAEYAGEFSHGKCHTSPALLWEDKVTELDVSGGWHDAGDYGRYVTAGACAAAHLLYAYKLYPKVFESQRLDIPERGDMPQILSECKYELLWLLKMQREDGGAYHKATTLRHAPFIMPEQDDAQLYVFPVSSMASADLAAVCALGAEIYGKFDKPFSDTLRSAAEKACRWLDENGFTPFMNPEGCDTGWYGERDDYSNRFWAYSQMYSLTGEKTYHDKLKAELNNEFPLTEFGYTEMGGLGALAYLLCGRETDPDLTERFSECFIERAERLKRIAENSGYGCAMEDRHFYWGSNMNVMQHAMTFAVSGYISRTDSFREPTSAQLYYLLGYNPLGISYVTGNGEFRCNYPHLRPAMADGVEECIPGMVSGGPNRIPGDEYAKKLIPEGTPPMKYYADCAACYSLNEITIYWNSPAAFVLAYLQNSRREKDDEEK